MEHEPRRHHRQEQERGEHDGGSDEKEAAAAATTTMTTSGSSPPPPPDADAAAPTAPVRAGPPSSDAEARGDGVAATGGAPAPAGEGREGREGGATIGHRRPRVASKSSSSLLPLHPTVIAKSIPSGTVTYGLRPYFASTATDDISDTVVRFWADAHVLSCCLRPPEPSLGRSASEVRDDFRTADDGCRSMCAVAALRAASVTVDGTERIERLDESAAGAVERGKRLIAVASTTADAGAAEENGAILAGRMLLLMRGDGAPPPGTSTGTGWGMVGATASALYSGASYVAWGAVGTVRGVTSLLSAFFLDRDDEYSSDELDDARRWDANERAAVVGTDSDAVGGGGEGSGGNEVDHRGDGDDVRLVSIDLVSACCEALTSHVQVYVEEHPSVLEYSIHDHEDGVEGDGAVKVILHRRGTGPGSFRSFCDEAADHLRSTTEQETASGPFASIEDVVKETLPDLLSDLTDNELDFLAAAMLSSHRARTSEDGTLLALHSTTLSGRQRHLSEVEVAAYRLVEARDANLARMDRLRSLADRAGEDAVAAKKRRGTSQRVVLNHMRRRRRYGEEADRCGDAVLTLESTLAALIRAADDRNVVKSMEVARDALRLVRSEHGDEDPVEAVDDVAFELDEQSRLGVAVGSALRTGVVVGVGDVAVGDEDELERELEGLVGHPPTGAGGEARGSVYCGDGGGGAAAAETEADAEAATSADGETDDGTDLLPMPVAPSGSGGGVEGETSDEGGRREGDVST